MKRKALFYALAVGTVFFASCSDHLRISPSADDLNCDTCLFMISHKDCDDGIYKLRRIDVDKRDEPVTSSKDNGIYHILRFHPKDDCGYKMWTKLWDNGKNGIANDRPSPLDSDFVRLNIAVTTPEVIKARSKDGSGEQDIAIGYLDQVPLEPNPDDPPKNDTIHE